MWDVEGVGAAWGLWCDVCECMQHKYITLIVTLMPFLGWVSCVFCIGISVDYFMKKSDREDRPVLGVASIPKLSPVASLTKSSESESLQGFPFPTFEEFFEVHGSALQNDVPKKALWIEMFDIYSRISSSSGLSAWLSDHAVKVLLDVCQLRVNRALASSQNLNVNLLKLIGSLEMKNRVDNFIALDDVHIFQTNWFKMYVNDPILTGLRKCSENRGNSYRLFWIACWNENDNHFRFYTIDVVIDSSMDGPISVKKLITLNDPVKSKTPKNPHPVVLLWNRLLNICFQNCDHLLSIKPCESAVNVGFQLSQNLSVDSWNCGVFILLSLFMLTSELLSERIVTPTTVAWLLPIQKTFYTSDADVFREKYSELIVCLFDRLLDGDCLLSVICAAQVAAVSDAEDEVDKPKVHEKYEKEKTNAAKLIEALQLFRNRRNNGTFASAPSTLQGDLPPATGGGGSEPRRQEGLLEEAGTGSVNTGNDVTTMNKEELLAYTMRKYGPNSVHGAKKTRKGPQKLVKIICAHRNKTNKFETR